MTILRSTILDAASGAFAFSSDQAAEAGRALQSQYVGAEPFPHIVLDDFIDQDLLRGLIREWPEAGANIGYNRSQERLKYEWQPVNLVSPRVRNFLAEMNSAPMLAFLEALTGIDKLIVDPHFMGGGLHETKAGGHLGVHADFNINKRINVVRRLNLLIYLNEHWDPAWNGALELWERDMSGRAKSVQPELGRAVIFNTDLDSFHGVPDPVACPPDRARRSVALYYYTAPTEGLGAIPSRTTVFRRRPDSQDKTDWAVWRRHMMADWIPPAIFRAVRGMKGR
ncbi:MAG: 2OG-Fe(II) oxygenase [Sphingopyxis sp.]|nr:2OG-Fe(II) oxygenase [Sphingopyxis sp.]